MWIPALGLGLFVLATVWLVISAAFEDNASANADEAGPTVEVAAPAEPAPAE